MTNVIFSTVTEKHARFGHVGPDPQLLVVLDRVDIYA